MLEEYSHVLFWPQPRNDVCVCVCVCARICKNVYVAMCMYNAYTSVGRHHQIFLSSPIIKLPNQ